LSADEISAFQNIVGSYLPDLRSVFLRGVDDGRGWDDDAGTRINGAIDGTTGVGSYQTNQIQSHGHTGSTSTDGNHNHGGQTGTGGYERKSDSGGTSGSAAENEGSHTHSISTDGNHSHTVTINNTGGAETRPENISVYYLIRGR
jgi:hypothetical protein